MGTVKNFGASVWNGFCGVFMGLCAFIIAVLFMLLKIVMFITSPLWFPVMVFINPERAACGLNDEATRDYGVRPTWFDWCLTWSHNLCIYYLMRWLWKPFIALLPMRYRAEFIRLGEKRVCEYSPKTQIAYYKSHDDGGKQSLLSSGVFSAEVREALWKDKTERDNWIAAGIELSRSQIADLCQNGSKAQLWRYFKQRTPNKEMFDLLLKYVREGYATPAEVVVNLIRQQRPNAELIGKLLNTGNNNFTERIGEVIDAYADLDAVDFGTQSITGVSDEEKQKIVAERWENLCKVKKSISLAAQKKMNHAQFKTFSATGHKLEYDALLHLLLNVNDEEYLKDIIATELDELEQIKDNRIQSALKVEYWRYSVYLAVKEAKLNS